MSMPKRNRLPARRTSPGRLLKLLGSAVLVSLASLYGVAADSAPQVELNTSKAGPREVESLTERSILRDYKFAWANMSRALETNSADALNGLFAGNAGAWLAALIKTQRNSGLSCRYLNQNHQVDAVFYAPEGDVIELHDTAQYDLEIDDGSKAIHSERVTVRYVVLMTPGEDRWVIRQMQAVPQF